MSRDTFQLVVLGTSCALALMCLLCLCSIADSAGKIASSATAMELMEREVMDSARRGLTTYKCSR